MKCSILYVAIVCVTWLGVESHLLLHEVLRRSQDSGGVLAAMMQYADSDKDRLLSGEEIENFYRYFINLTPGEALMTARQFIRDGDLNNDGRLNETELRNALKKYSYTQGR